MVVQTQLHPILRLCTEVVSLVSLHAYFYRSSLLEMLACETF
jgi:hypothetical protein